MSKIKILSFNVNGIRAAEKKGVFKLLSTAKPDILCLQETKIHSPEILNHDLVHPDGYTSYWNCGVRKGYSGVAVFSKIKPLSVVINFGSKILADEGRILQLEFPKFYLFNVYFPNGGVNNRRVPYKLKFYNYFLTYVKKLEKTKPVIFGGDVNTAHQEIDLARPKENSKNTGFLPEERAWIDQVMKAGYLDSFREFNKRPNQYSYWDMKSRARERNVGWRIDYFFVSPKLRRNLKRAFILPEIMGSDHCPVGIEITI